MFIIGDPENSGFDSRKLGIDSVKPAVHTVNIFSEYGQQLKIANIFGRGVSTLARRSAPEIDFNVLVAIFAKGPSGLPFGQLVHGLPFDQLVQLNPSKPVRLSLSLAKASRTNHPDIQRKPW